MSEIVNQSLQKIVKGTMIVFVGTIIGMLLGFAGRVIIARYFSQSEYGIFSLAFITLSFIVMLGCLGLEGGATRQIAFYRGKDETSKVRSVVFSSLQIAAVASVFLFLLLFFTSSLISTSIFHSMELSAPLKILSFGIPFLVLISILSSIFRGFDNVAPRAYFQNILFNALFPLFLIVVISIGWSFLTVFYAYLASILLTCLAFVVYAMKKPPLPIKREKAIAISPIRKELLFFSLPLFAGTMLGVIMGWADTVMLGYFKTPDIVGLYNGALPLARVISLPASSMLFIYLPIASQLYAKGSIEEMRRNYKVLVKWICSAIMPVFLILLLFPETVLNLFFGASYIPASNALRILVAGFFIGSLLGPNGTTLIVMGKTRFFMWASLAGAGINVILNIVLIPPLGIVGASIASLISHVLGGTIKSVKLYSLAKFQPLSKNLLKPMVTSTGLIFLIYFLVKTFFDVTPPWMLPILLVAFLGLYGLTILFTRSFDREDIAMLLAIEERLGLNLTLIKGILKRFVK